MSLTPEQNAAWCRKCIDIIKGDESVSEPKSKTFAGMDTLEIDVGDSGVVVSQYNSDGSIDCIFLPDHFIKQFTKELLEVAGLA